ncbi:Fimbrial protein [BD1-7 clade bacterium]|uniref:Fimbrial protein n=1 Tax=BD1-7 clade bacterium TaxID=2029982 RepID=A0A5S9QIG0_9GAMM|nr:Fimbrial protein [BD1-7 clade bacterium]
MPTKHDTRTISDDKNVGFSLMELMIVLAIIAILMTLAMPDLTHKHAREDVNETLEKFDRFKSNIEVFYVLQGRFPEDHIEASMPASDKLIGNNFTGATVEKGAIHIYFGNKATAVLRDKVLSLRPLYVPDSPRSPISWACGYDQAPQGMEASATNLTDVAIIDLPLNCRNRTPTASR